MRDRTEERALGIGLRRKTLKFLLAALGIGLGLGVGVGWALAEGVTEILEQATAEEANLPRLYWAIAKTALAAPLGVLCCAPLLELSRRV